MLEHEMNAKTKLLAVGLFALALAACGRHKKTEPTAALPEQNPVAVAAAEQPPVPAEAPKVNEPPPPVSKDTAAQKIFSGVLQPSGVQHVSGAATILKTDDGYAVRIEGLRIDDDLSAIDVVLTTHPVSSAADAANGVVVGEIKGATGNMNYPLRAGFDPTKYPTLSLIVRGKNQLLATASFGLM
jgi:hypothetical protein